LLGLSSRSNTAKDLVDDPAAASLPRSVALEVSRHEPGEYVVHTVLRPTLDGERHTLPEPGSLLLLVIGLGIFGLAARRQLHRAART
jgi:hypothetical protein